ncbi:MAG: V-type ATP synthase subunit I [Vallitaleaceae bacterium]|nr:V-type ATP synthase subunit I [Vallitaleaceae bacterium]
MAVEKMYFVNAAGPIKEIDSFVMNHLASSEIQLINSTSVVGSDPRLKSFDDRSPYEVLLKKISALCREMSIDTSVIDIEVHEAIDVHGVEIEFDELNSQFESLIIREKELEAIREHKKVLRRQSILIQDLNIEVDVFYTFEYMKFRFGKIPKESFEKITELQEKMEVIIYEVHRDLEDVYIVYFMPRMVQPEIDEFFSSLSFTRIRISDEVKGFPKKSLLKLEAELEVIEAELQEIIGKIGEFNNSFRERMTYLYGAVSKLHHIFSVRQYAIHTKEAFYMTGWVPASKMEAFVEKTKKSDVISFVVEEDEDKKEIVPPTKLVNGKFFKPFETFISMYGVPNYKEMDPTLFVGITYILMFGIMFGDLGQGFVIAALGAFVYKKYDSALGHIAIYLGVCSMITGIFYGSLFGNEEFLRHHLSFIPMINPMEHKNEVLFAAIGFGILLIIIAMAINMVNSIKSKKLGRLLFDRNGLVGIVIYFSILYVVLVKVISLKTPIFPAIVLIGVSLVIILLSHPLQKLVEGKKDFMPEDKGSYFIEAFFELVETLLAILSNTISFMRVGAFALNHVGFFLAFKMLSEMVEKSMGTAGSIGVLIFGNILIIVLEGFIVGIQGLRLEYYELFSRFFNGEGIEFKPFLKVNKIKS